MYTYLIQKLDGSKNYIKIVYLSFQRFVVKYHMVNKISLTFSEATEKYTIK